MKVIKRDGTVVDFDRSRIEIAIGKAFKSEKGTVDSKMEKVAKQIAKYIENLDNTDLSVESIQDIVEEQLMKSKYPEVAREYITYRHKRNIERKRQEKINKEIDKKLMCENIENANANVDEYSFGGRKFEAAGILLKDKALNTMSQDVADAHRQNRIYIHDLDSYILGMHNCSFVDIQKLLKQGFVTRNGDVRPPKSISTAMQQVAVIFQCQSQVQYGGTGSAHIDFDLAPYVAMSFEKHFKDGLEDIEEYNNIKVSEIMSSFDIKIGDKNIQKLFSRVYNYALKHTERECMQAAQGLYHNLNTLESRAGSQLPFTSINFGRDTSPEGRMVTKSLLEASIDGIGEYHRTSIFPISIFQHKKGINADPGDPNYDLKLLAIKSLCKRIYPNWSNNDFSENIEDPENPDTYLCTMGLLY